MLRRLTSCIVACFLCFWAGAQGSSLLDPNFGSNGKVIVDVDSIDHCEVVLTDQVGNVYFLGYSGYLDSSGTENHDYVIGKLDSSGTLDLTFGNQGIVRGDFPDYNNSEITDAEIGDSAIYFCGNGGLFGSLDTQHVYVGKISLDGELDTTFADSGFYQDWYESDYNEIRTIHLLPDDRLLLGGITFDSLILHREVAFFGRLKANGERDSTFGGTGVRTWNLIDGLQNGMGHLTDSRHIDGTIINDITPDPWGTYFMTGYFDDGTIFRVLTIRVDSMGDLYSPYGTGGVFIYDFNPTLKQNAIVAKPYLDRMVLSIRPGVQGDFVAQSIDSLGALGPVQYIDVQGNHDQVENMMVTTSGQLYVVGQSVLPSNIGPGYISDFFTVYRYKPGMMELDSLFTGTASPFFAVDFGLADANGALSLAECPQGIVVGGYLHNGGVQNHSDFGFMRIQPQDSVVADLPLVSATDFQVYPNPTSGEIRLSDVRDDARIDLYSSNGTLVRQWRGPVQVLDLSAYESGVYLLSVSTGRESTMTRVVLLR